MVLVLCSLLFLWYSSGPPQLATSEGNSLISVKSSSKPVPTPSPLLAWRLPPVGGEEEYSIVPWTDELRAAASSEPAVYWPSPVVIVPSYLNEFNGGLPAWAAKGLLTWRAGYPAVNGDGFLPSSPYVYLYQKKDPTASHYSINQGRESSNALKFIIDHYHRLPDHVVFVHALPQNHNRNALRWLSCLLPNATFSTLNSHTYLNPRTPAYWGDQDAGWVGKCWHYWLQRGGFNYSLERVMNEGMSGQCCAQATVSRDRILRVPLQVWVDWYGVLESAGPFDPGASSLSRLNVSCTPEPGNPFSLPLFSPFDVTYRLFGHLWEHISHSMLGGVDLRSPLESPCNNFYPASICPGSPCNDTGAQAV